jgi:uncharacterized protein
MAAINLSSAYSQNFDSLFSVDSTGSWINDYTGAGPNGIPGWYANQATINTDAGTSNTGALYSYGAASASIPNDRALGSIASGTTNPIIFGARFNNNTSSTISSLAINYTGEQWRSSTSTQNSLTFAYRIGTPAADLTSGTWTNFTALNYTGAVPVASNGALNGNATQTPVSATITGLSIGVGQDVWIRWTDIDDAGSDAGLAIDNFSLSAVANTTAVPEPSDFMGSIVAMLAVAIVVKRKLARKSVKL